MTDDDVFRADLEEHVSGDLTREGALFRPGYVFRAHFDVAALAEHGREIDVGVRHADNDVAVGGRHEGLELLDKQRCLRSRHVHFPVTGDDWSSCHLYFFLRLDS